MSYMRDGLGRTGFTLLGIDKDSVGIVHPVPVITLRKLKGAYWALSSNNLENTVLEKEELRELSSFNSEDQGERDSTPAHKRSLLWKRKWSVWSLCWHWKLQVISFLRPMLNWLWLAENRTVFLWKHWGTFFLEEKRADTETPLRPSLAVQLQCTKRIKQSYSLSSLTDPQWPCILMIWSVPSPPVSLCVQHNVYVHTVLPVLGRNLGDSFHSADYLPSLLFMHQWQLPFLLLKQVLATVRVSELLV